MTEHHPEPAAGTSDPRPDEADTEEETDGQARQWLNTKISGYGGGYYGVMAALTQSRS